VSNVREGYDRVADEYARRISRELDDKPFDRAFLDRFVARVGIGRKRAVADVGCGPGHVARYLHERGLHVAGIDLSPAMVALARELVPGVEFRTGDMCALDAEDLAGIVAFYSLIHIPPDRIPGVLAGFRRALVPGAPLAIAFHIGSQVVHLDDWWDRPVSIDFYFFETAAICAMLETAGFVVDEAVEREPYPGVEHASRRAYLVAR
jgi:SAM-dependent methyltransferase